TGVFPTMWVEFICELPDLNVTANAWLPVAVFCASGGQQTRRPAKRVCDYVMRVSVGSGTVRFASGGAP
ncbi:MAG: hypothetical protein ACLRV5_14460, partial [Acutalibacteraceae bacterium]